MKKYWVEYQIHGLTGLVGVGTWIHGFDYVTEESMERMKEEILARRRKENRLVSSLCITAFIPLEE